MLQPDPFRNALKKLENEHELHTHPDVPFYSLSAKIRCCHLRNNIISMWYEVFLILLVLSVWIVWVGLFFFRNLDDCLMCVFFCVCYLAATLWRTTGGPVSQSFPAFGFKAGSWWKRPPSRPLQDSCETVLVGLSVGLPRLCFNMLHCSGTWFSRISHVKICTKNQVVLNKKKKEQCL